MKAISTRIPAMTPIPSEAWFKSSYSGGTGNNCVEIADAQTVVGVRDSKQVNGPALAVSRTTFHTFVASLGEAARTA
ncbi:DUF397 domain-containing protein [Streptomyces sp. NPDC048717]|uniref:DUF397 domain-containing protein n=1 Tax=Streptomyces sp. NPDC048717 TaxID=3154928 RepID=UPI003438E2ED